MTKFYLELRRHRDGGIECLVGPFNTKKEAEAADSIILAPDVYYPKIRTVNDAA